MTVWTETDPPHAGSQSRRTSLILMLLVATMVTALTLISRVTADPPPIADSVSGLPTWVMPSQTYELTVNLSGAAQGNTSVNITYDGDISGPSTVTVPNGETSAAFNASTAASGGGPVGVSAAVSGQTPEEAPICQALWID